MLDQGADINRRDRPMAWRSFPEGRFGLRPAWAAGVVTALALLLTAGGLTPALASEGQEASGLWENLSHIFKDLPHPLIIFTFLFFLCLAEGLFLYLSDPDRLHQRRLKKRLKFLNNMEIRLPQDSLLRGDGLGTNPWLRQILKNIRHMEYLQTLMMQADLQWSVSTFLLVSLLSGSICLSLGFFQRGPLGGLGGLGVGLLLPYRALVFKKKRRLKKFEKQLPEALDLMARGLKAGHAFAAGLQMVGEEMPSPIGLEFFKTFKEYNHGLDLNTALINLCQRVELRELRFFATAVIIQRETGGNLTDILEKIASLVRERFKLRNQIKALTAEGRLSGWILILMPPVLFLIMLKINPDYTLLLINHDLGRMMALTALTMQMLGMLAIRKIVNIKV